MNANLVNDEQIANLNKIGYLDVFVDPNLDLISEINHLKKEKNAVILAHYYQDPDIQDIADFVENDKIIGSIRLRPDLMRSPVVDMQRA